MQTPSTRSQARRNSLELWRAFWPEVAAALLGLGIWHLVALSGWRPSWVLPGPIAVLSRLVDETASGEVFHSVAITMVRAAVGFAIAVVVGTVLGLLLTTSKTLRS